VGIGQPGMHRPHRHLHRALLNIETSYRDLINF
jgi:hypothetical protein